MSNHSVNLTDQQARTYREQGFVSLPAIMAADEVQKLQVVFDRIFSKPKPGVKPLYYDLTGNDPDAEMGQDAVPHLLYASQHIPDLKATQAWQGALCIAMQLLDVGNLTQDDLIVRDHAIVKPPHSTGATAWHQDEVYWEGDLQYNELSVWIALQDTTQEMGCMQFIPGSHHQPIHPHHSWKNDPKIVALEIDDGHMDLSDAHVCPLPAGGATVHHTRTMHFASGNDSDQPRRALILTIGTPPTKRDTPRDFYWNNKEHSHKDHIITSPSDEKTI